MQATQPNGLRVQAVRVRSNALRAPVLHRLNAVTVRNDATVRVKGDVKRVFLYVTDLTSWPQWYPGVAYVERTRGSGPSASIRSQFKVTQKIANMDFKTIYEVADVDEDRKVLYSAASKEHTTTDQFVFMPDPNDASFTIVRYMSNMQLSGWKKALQPVFNAACGKLPEEALNSLAKLAMQPDNPMVYINVPKQRHGGRYGVFGNSSASSSSSKSSSPPPRTSNGTARLRTGSYASSRSNGWSWDNLFAKVKREEAVIDENGALQDFDALGYYKLLGLDAARGATLSTDEVKAAFRKAAMVMHPDKFSSADDEERDNAVEMFRQVQQAYEVLRNPETKRAYDEGRLVTKEGSAR